MESRPQHLEGPELAKFKRVSKQGSRRVSERDSQVRQQDFASDSDTTLRLQQISTLLICEDNNDALYERVLDAAISLMSADMGSMQIFHTDRGELRLLTERGFHPESAAFWKWIGPDAATSCAMALSTKHRVVVPDIEACDIIAGTPHFDACRRSGIRALQSTPLVARSGRLLGMISTHWRQPHHPTERELQPVDVLARQAADLIERNEVEAALRESREQFRWLASIVESSFDAIISENLDGVITSWNRGAERLYGYLAEEVIGKPVTILIPPDRHHEENFILERIRRGDRVCHHETVGRSKDESVLDIWLTVSPVRDANGTVVGASKIARDITERKRSEAQIAILAREAEHRARNLLANVKAMVQLSQADTPDSLKEAIGGRLEALTKVHSLFARSRWTGAKLRSLIKQELSPYSRAGDMRTQIDGPPIMLKPDLAQAIAVALHELATNAAKYGALSVDTGRVRVEWRRADGRLVLRWTEAGGPPVKPPTRRGFGTNLMQTLIRSHEGGAVRLDWNAEGLTCEIVLPA
jgi:PAS domain S-box-containing protein